jgi:two-component system cell cycle response regulator
MDGFDSAAFPHDAQPSGQIILVLRNLLGERYPDLGRHVNTVARLCEETASELEREDGERRALSQAAHLHDIGKLSLPEAILTKPGPLTDAEWTLMRLHTVVGERILAAAGLSGLVLEFVRSSHERTDGTGYPDGLGGDEIALGARIIAVCDAYEAMTSIRPYRPTPMTSDGACLELMRGSGSQFDAAVVDLLCARLLRVGSPA